MDRFANWQRPVIEHGVPTKWNWVVLYPDNLVLGQRTDIGTFTLIQAQEGVEIGDEVQIGSHCAIYSVSTIDNKRGKVVIGKGAKIGTHSSVMPGVTIGEGAIVGAHSFVTRDVLAGAVHVGIPARELKKNG